MLAQRPVSYVAHAASAVEDEDASKAAAGAPATHQALLNQPACFHYAFEAPLAVLLDSDFLRDECSTPGRNVHAVIEGFDLSKGAAPTTCRLCVTEQS